MLKGAKSKKGKCEMKSGRGSPRDKRKTKESVRIEGSIGSIYPLPNRDVFLDTRYVRDVERREFSEWRAFMSSANVSWAIRVSLAVKIGS